MKTSVLLVALVLSAALSCPAQTVESHDSVTPDSSFEVLPVLNASEILKPEFLKGPHHAVREPVPTASGENQFVIDSDYGVFDAEGNEMLVRRVGEINAIAQLKDVSRTDAYKDALLKAAKSPLIAAKNIVADPVGTAKNVPKGISKFLGRAGDSIKNIGKKEEGKDRAGNDIEQLSGYSDTKRKLASSFGVDPYSTNPVLQKELNGIAKASFLGGMTVQAATIPLSGGASMALSGVNATATLNDVLRDKSPADLKKMNHQMLADMGATPKEIDRFLQNNAFSPSEQTAFVLNLRSLDGVANRAAFVRAAGTTSSDQSDALFCIQTAALMSGIHKEKPLARIVMLGNFPICIAKDGTVVLAMQWDYAAWTSAAASLATSVQKIAAESGKNKKVLVALSGQTSPRLQQELKDRGFVMRDRVSPGPLK